MKIVLKTLPYLASFLTGIFFYWLSLYRTDNLSSLLINIASAFIAIPFLYFIYELSKSYSHRKINSEIYDYAKKKIDKDIISLAKQIMILIYPYYYTNTSIRDITRLLSISLNDLSEQLSRNKFVGFQIFKNYSEIYRNIERVFDSPFILNRLSEQQITSVIKLIKSLHSLEDVIVNVPDLFIITEETDDRFEILGGSNKDYPNSYLLLEKKNDKESKVIDWGGIISFKKKYLLNICRMNTKYLEPFSNEVFDILLNINKWLSLTGNEFVIDTKRFKFSFKENKWTY